MSEDRNRLAMNDDGEQADDDVEAHRLVAKDPTIEGNSDDSDEDVEGGACSRAAPGESRSDA
jgi:hypothetical protein